MHSKKKFGDSHKGIEKKIMQMFLRHRMEYGARRLPTLEGPHLNTPGMQPEGQRAARRQVVHFIHINCCCQIRAAPVLVPVHSTPIMLSLSQRFSISEEEDTTLLEGTS